MTKARLINFGPSICPLEPKQPRQRGAGGIEALSSYIAARALDHNCSPYTLFSNVLIPSEERLNARWRRVRHGESHLINSCGEVASAVADAVAACANLPKAPRMTLRGLERLCDPIAKHLMHLVRPWCPDCYLEARARDVPAWDALYTYVRTSKVCAWHKRPLLLSCSKCGSDQRFLPKFPFLDFCERCGADLAKQEGAPPPWDQSLTETNLWFSQAALDMVDSLTRDRNMSAKDFAGNVQWLMTRHFGGKEQPFARHLGLAGSSPKNWLKRGSAPTWASLVDLSFRLDIPPGELCSSEPTLTDPQYWRQRPPASLDKPHIRPSPEALVRLRSALADRLELEDTGSGPLPEGLPRFAKRLQVPLGVLKRHFPDECAQLIERRITVLRARREASCISKSQRMADAMATLSAKGLTVTSRNLRRTGQLKVSDLVAGALKAPWS